MYNARGPQQYKRADVNSMPREKLVVLLYERLIADFRDSIKDCEQDNRLAMTKNLNHANRILGELRMALDHDIGGEIAKNLDALYQYAFSECLEQMVDRDPRHARNAVAVLEPLLESWRKIPVGTADKAEREQVQGTNPANTGVKETAEPAISGHEASGSDLTSPCGTLSVSA